MKIVEINSGFRGSTGNIMLNIADTARKNGEEVYTFSEIKKEAPPKGHSYFGTRVENLCHRFVSVFTGISGTGSGISTRQLLRKIEEIDPDILHLHNLHGWYINLPLLFDFIKKHNIKTVWTLHDCWGFTAQCAHFTIEKCTKWKTGCYACPRFRIYPYTFVDRTKKMWELKRKWFIGVKDLTLVTPSQWLADLVKQSFLNQYEVRVLNNGINLDIFRPTNGDFRDKYLLQGKKVVLGVASGWSNRKGLDVFIELAKRLPNEYKIVLVGTNDSIDKQLPKEILSIHRTNNQRELAEIYTAADVFVNPTREENFPTVNMESIACGTPVVTFRTGGSPEIVDDTTGVVVECNNIDCIEQAVISVCENELFSKDRCIMRSKKFDMNDKYSEYITLYNDILARRRGT